MNKTIFYLKDKGRCGIMR